MDVKMNFLISNNQSQVKTIAVRQDRTVPTNIKNEVQTDVYEHIRPEKKVTYDKPGVNAKTIQELQEESDKAYSHLKQIVREMLKRQGLKFRELEIVPGDNPETEGLSITDLRNMEIDETARKEAQAMIAAGGEYSPEKVSDRIVDFAKAISGGDTSKYELLKSAIDQGFKAAEADFGDELPDISKETYLLVMAKLEAWAKKEEVAVDQTEEQENCQTV